jgi:chloramphenicol O-acetyltransferase
MKEESHEHLFSAHVKQSARSFAQLRVWRVTHAAGQPPQLKYRLALIENGTCVLCFDNHDKKESVPYAHSLAPATTVTALLTEFWQRVDDYNTTRQP